MSLEIKATVFAAACSIALFVVGVWSIQGYRQGVVEITNNQEIAKDLLAQDLDRMEEEMVVVCKMGCEWLWEAVAQTVKERLADGARIILYVGPDFRESESETIIELAHLDGVQLYLIPECPRVDIRVVDDKYVYIGYHGVDAGYERPCLYSKDAGAGKGAVRAAKKYIEQYTKGKEPYQLGQ